MEILLQYLDDLDDLYGMVGLVSERVRSMTIFLLAVSCAGVAAFLATALYIAS